MSVPVLGVVHVNANCSDLGRSLAFYRDQVGLAPLVHTAPGPQDGAGFGLPGRVRWDAHLLYDARGARGPALDLLEWKQPLPVGKPAAEANQLGPFRLCLSVPDVDATYARLLAAGVPCLSAPATAPIDPAAGLAVRFFCARDPDGAAVEFLEAPGAPPEPRLLHLNVNCADLARSGDWYRRVLGLRTLGASRPGPVDGAGFGWSGPCEWHAEFLAVPGEREPFVIDLLEWRTPRPSSAPPRQANQLGWTRLAFLVDDARSCHAELTRLGVEATAPVWLEMGPEVPIEGLWAVFFRDPDGTCLELIERPAMTGG
jgi:catechol 2,3-dioxygenase-like lactoylglutathione lyase family enzyme